MGEQNVYRISVGNLDEHFVESLREKYPNAALEIKVNASPQPGGLTESQFWAIIDMLDWSKEGDSDAVIITLNQCLKTLHSAPCCASPGLLTNIKPDSRFDMSLHST